MVMEGQLGHEHLMVLWMRTSSCVGQPGCSQNREGGRDSFSSTHGLSWSAVLSMHVTLSPSCSFSRDYAWPVGLNSCLQILPVGWLMNKTGLGKRLLLTVKPNKSHVHKTSSKPIITLSFPQYSRTLSKTSSLMLPQVPLCSWLHSQHARCTKGVKGYGQRSNCEKLTVKILIVVAVVTAGHNMGVTPSLQTKKWVETRTFVPHTHAGGGVACVSWVFVAVASVVSSPDPTGGWGLGTRLWLLSLVWWVVSTVCFVNIPLHTACSSSPHYVLYSIAS